MERHGSSGIDTDPRLYECESCGGIAVGEVSGLQCCETAMVEIDPATVDADVPEPRTDRVLQTVFGLSPTSLEIARRLRGRGEREAQEITAALDYDRSTVTRHLNSLTDIGIVKRRTRSLEDGGRVYLYRVGSNEDVRRQFRRVLYAWVAAVLEGIDEFGPE